MRMDTDFLVIGASASGLAAAASLKRAGREVELLEAAAAVGDSWRHHYDRLHLHTPKSISSLPGLGMPAAWSRYPGRDQVVQYLERYREHHQLEPHYGQQVSRLDRLRDMWVATTADREWRASNVVVCTGLARRPVRPTWPGLHEYGGEILHSSQYRNGEKWRGRTVVVVGFGNSACEQAIDLVEHGASAHLSVRSAVNVIPRDIFGVVPILRVGILMRPLPTRLADALARPLIRATVGDIRKLGLRRLPYGPLTQIARDRHIPLLDIGTIGRIREGTIEVKGEISRFSKHGVVFTDGTSLTADAVVLATGYRPALEEFLPEWRRVCDGKGVPFSSGTTTALPGLSFCGHYVSPAGMLREIGMEARRLPARLRPHGG